MADGVKGDGSGGKASGEARGEYPEKGRKSGRASWLWPVGMVATSLAGVGVLLMRGCWHRRMSWPVRAQGYSYQVCLSCGVKRLFDEKRFCSYGPFRYDLSELIAREKADRGNLVAERHLERPAS